VRRGGRLVGLVPWFVYTAGSSPTRTVLFLGTGISDVLDGLLDPECEGLIAGAVFQHLARARWWDVCELQQLPERSALLTPEVPGAWDHETTVQDPCPVLTLPASGEDLASCLPPQRLARLKYYQQRASKIGPVQLDQAEENNFPELFEALFRLHRARWASQGLPGVLQEDALHQFHQEVAWGFLRTGVLRLYGLRIGGNLVASLYGFQAKGRTYYYLGGFDPNLARVSPGAILIGHAVREAVREGSTEFDFLRGREPYKYWWGARDRLNYRRRLQLHGQREPRS